MGTSISSIIECKHSNGKWKFENSSIIEDNYRLFAILADVRNWDDIKPISQPRGLPDDLDIERKKRDLLDPTPMDSKQYLQYLGTQCCSYYTLKDLKDYDWDQIATLKRYVRIDSYREWMKERKVGQPKHHCVGVFGSSNIISNSEMEDMINFPPNDGQYIPEAFYTRIEWDSSYKDLCPEFYYETIHILEKLSEKYGGLENVRIVFCFW